MPAIGQVTAVYMTSRLWYCSLRFRIGAVSMLAAVSRTWFAMTLWLVTSAVACAQSTGQAASPPPTLSLPRTWQPVDVVEHVGNGQWAPTDIQRPVTTAETAPLVADMFCHSLRDDLRAWPRQFLYDTHSVTHQWFDIGLGGVLAAVSANNWDHHIRANTAKHERRWGDFNDVLDVAGHPAAHLSLAGAFYAGSFAAHDESLHEFSTALFNALVITDLGTTGLKYAFDTTRPNGESHGFPSGHTASAFALAAVVEERYGGWYGFGARTFACMVAWNRIDDRKHDLSDVIFGAAFGYAVGEAVAKRRKLGDAKLKVHAYTDPENRAYGVVVQRDY